MADYKRMVSYMYKYEDGVKKKNVGYARVESRNGQCKITMNMQLRGLLDSIFPTYLICRKNNEMELIYLGDSILKNQILDSRLTAEEINIKGSGRSLSEMGGLLLFLNDHVFFATKWDDIPIVLNDVLDALNPNKKFNKKKEEENVLAEVDHSDTKGHDKEDKNDGNKTSNKENERFTESINSEETTSKNKESIPSKENIEVSNNKVTEKKSDNNMKTIKSNFKDKAITLQEELAIPVYKLPRGWKTIERLHKPNEGKKLVIDKEPSPKKKTEADKILDSFPKIYPFEDNEIIKCVKIEPKDIEQFPAKYRGLSNNSFLMHGYYCYHHIIFASLKDGLRSRYLIGVPGIYHNRERFMARMFGFENFKSIRKREIRQGDFGYWYIIIAVS